MSSVLLRDPLRIAGVRLFALAMIVFTLTRLGVALQSGTIGAGDIGAIAAAFALGLVGDALAAAIIALVVFGLMSLARRLRPAALGRAVSHGIVMAAAALLLFGGLAELFFFNEFSQRFNGIAVYYLLFPREVIGNLQESFHISWYLPLLAGFGLGFWWLNKRAMARSVESPERRRFLRGLAEGAGLIAVSAAGASLLPGRISANREINEIAKNGLVSLVEAAATNDAAYEGVYPGMARTEAVETLRRIVAQDNTRFIGDPILRRVTGNGPARRLNVVMVTEESFGSIFVDRLDNRGLPVSTDLDPLIDGGLLLGNIYAQGDRTVRGLEATETGFAPIPGISTARRPGCVGMHSLPRLLKGRGYRSGLLYGGITGFDNMATFWNGIGFDHVWGQTDVRHDSFTTIWGVSDGDLFTEALARMDELTAEGPALLTLMTVSNHRPYRFPEGPIRWDDRYDKIHNTARYAQWAFADFIARARSKPWFDDTIFVFVADHSIKVNGAAEVPVQSFRIPVLFYAPRHVAPGRLDTLGAQIDVIPTLMGLLGGDYDSPFFGVDLRRVPAGGGRFALAHNFSIAYGRPGHVVVLLPSADPIGYAFAPGLSPLTPEPPDPETLRQAIAQTQEAHRLFYARGYHVADGSVG